jgi:hypothetical protein
VHRFFSGVLPGVERRTIAGILMSDLAPPLTRVNEIEFR